MRKHGAKAMARRNIKALVEQVIFESLLDARVDQLAPGVLERLVARQQPAPRGVIWVEDYL